MLHLKDISKTYGSVESLDKINLKINKGEVLALLGDNGAGKSTLLKILAGTEHASSGEIFTDKEPQKFNNVEDARNKGIDIVYQNLALCDDLSVYENIFLGKELTNKFGTLRKKEMIKTAEDLISKIGANIPALKKVKNLSGGQRQAIAIARAMLGKAQYILLDEPTAAISVKQIKQVLNLIISLKNQGVGVVLVTHRIPDVFEVCDKVVILRHGSVVMNKTIQQTNIEEITGFITGAKTTS